MIPSSFLWTRRVSGAWYVYNATGGGLHSMLLWTESLLGCDNPLSGEISAFGLITSYYSVLGDQGQSAFIFRAITQATEGGANAMIYVPAVTIAFGIVGMILSVAAAFTPHGADKSALDLDSLLLSGLALIIGGIGLLNYGPTLWKFQLYGITLVGEAVGGVEASMALLGVAAGCS
jgi:hypothetical protein